MRRWEKKDEEILALRTAWCESRLASRTSKTSWTIWIKPWQPSSSHLIQILAILNSMSEWNSSEYHRLTEPQVAWGKKVLERLRLRGDELLLDAGCGTGRLTELFLEILA